MSSKINCLVNLAIVSILVLTFVTSPVVAQTNDSQITVTSATSTTEGTTIVLNWFSVWIVTILIALLAFLFWLLIMYSNRLDQTSYVARLYHQAIEKSEYEAMENRIRDKYATQGYVRDVLETTEWAEKNPEPPYPAPQAEDYDIYNRSDVSRPPTDAEKDYQKKTC